MDDQHADLDLVVRNLNREDLTRLVEMDRRITGRSRRFWYEGKLKRALESDIQLSLGVELDGRLVGAMLCSVHYGEFGLPEPLAVLDTVLVDPEYSGRKTATALFEQLVKNLKTLRIERLRTEVAWDEFDLLRFFHRRGFRPVPRTVLETRLDGDT